MPASNSRPLVTPEEVLQQLGPPKPTGLRRFARSAGLVVAVLAVIAGLAVWRARSNETRPMKYFTAAVSRGDLAATVTATGTLRGKDTVSIGAEINGRVRAVHVDFNDEVKAGQVLVELDPAQATAALDQSRAQLLAARADVKNREATAVEAKLAAERTRGLVTDGLASKQALEAAQAAADRAAAAVDSARAQVIVSEAAVQANGTSLSKTQVRSPIDGVVLSREVEVGQTLAVAMTTPVLFKVARDLREMEVTISIDEADVGHTKAGQQARFSVDAWPGRTFPGELASIHNVAVTRDNVVTYEALLRVRNDEALLRPGMTATVTIETDARQRVLLVPNAALRFRPPERKKLAAMGPPEQVGPVVSDVRPRVYVLRDAAPLEQVVQVGLTDGVHTEVQGEGLAEGDLVIVDAQQDGVP